MRLKQTGNRWELFGRDGTDQATDYTDTMWTLVLEYIKRGIPHAERALILGIAMGRTPHLVLHQWPKARVTGIDWEPALLDLGRTLGVSKQDPRFDFMAGDAQEIIPRLEGHFDVVLVDLFDGGKVAKAVTDPDFQKRCAHLVSPSGMMCINYFNQPKVVKGWTAFFPKREDITYKTNGLALLAGNEYLPPDRFL